MAVTARLEPDALDPAAELARFQRGRTADGAIVSFTGLVRAEGGGVEALVLDAYPALTERSLDDIGQAVAAAAAAPDAGPITDVLIVHRTGTIPAGDPVVFVAVAAPHRRAAFLAADQLMDRLKTEAALWKSELTPSGPRRIEPTRRDHADRARWSD